MKEGCRLCSLLSFMLILYDLTIAFNILYFLQEHYYTISMNHLKLFFRLFFRSYFQYIICPGKKI